MVSSKESVLESCPHLQAGCCRLQTQIAAARASTLPKLRRLHPRLDQPTNSHCRHSPTPRDEIRQGLTKRRCPCHHCLVALGLHADRKSTRLNSSHSCASRMPS